MVGIVHYLYTTIESVWHNLSAFVSCPVHINMSAYLCAQGGIIPLTPFDTLASIIPVETGDFRIRTQYAKRCPKIAQPGAYEVTRWPSSEGGCGEDGARRFLVSTPCQRSIR